MIPPWLAGWMQSKLAALAQEAQMAQAASTSYVSWMGANHPVRHERVKLALHQALEFGSQAEQVVGRLGRGFRRIARDRARWVAEWMGRVGRENAAYCRDTRAAVDPSAQYCRSDSALTSRPGHEPVFILFLAPPL